VTMAESGVPQTCPRCGRHNECALAAGVGSVTECWCAEVRMDAARLAPYRDQAQCLCRGCADAGQGIATLRS